jgi:hypothetical protein
MGNARDARRRAERVQHGGQPHWTRGRRADKLHLPAKATKMNQLYYGDNLAVLRNSIADESVDLVYLDPPFNSNASYNVLFRGPSGNHSAAQIEAFDDTWHWTDAAEEAFQEVRRSGNANAAAAATLTGIAVAKCDCPKKHGPNDRCGRDVTKARH